MNKYSFNLLIVCFSLLLTVNLRADEESFQEVKIQLAKGKGSIYQLLNQVSEQSGYMFIYDSQLIDNDKVVKVPVGEYTLTDAIRLITGNNQINIRTIGNHILLYIPVEAKKNAVSLSLGTTEEDSCFTMEGTLLDHLSGDPIIYGSISVSGNSYGTISNQNGEFKLILPDSLLQSTIKFSHIGYITREIEASLLSGRHIVFYMDQKVIPLQEVVVRAVDPLRTIGEMMDKRRQNYSLEPVYITAFYREGVEYKKNVTLSEAVLKIYKTGFLSSVGSEQVKLLKMRRMTNNDDKDAFVAKIKSSVNSSQLLDLVKNPTDFLLQESQPQYSFAHTDITTIDDRRVYVFSFEQHNRIVEPLFRGELYIDADNYALIKARFEVHPDYVRKTKDMLVLKSSHNLDVIPEKVVYEVEYKLVNNIYYINHIRGDLDFKVRKKNRMFSSNLHMWLEMVNCKIDTLDVKRFPNDERISTHNIFAETRFSYDKDFWGNFNVILPEEKLKEIIQKYNFNQKKY